MTTTWHRDPFSTPHGRRPMVFAPRPDLFVRLDDVAGRLGAQRFVRSTMISGPTGIGKTTVLTEIARMFGSRQWLVVRIDLRPRVPLAAQVSAGVEQAVVSAGGRRILPRRRPWLKRFKASTKLPFIEVQYTGPEAEHDGQPEPLDAVWRAIARRLHDRTPVVLLIDEADFLTGEEYEDVLVPFLDRASREDLPFTIFGAGMGASFRRSVRGESTFPLFLTSHIQLHRFNYEESHRLLVETAWMGGQDWSSWDLSDALRLCSGIPRRLHDFGSALFCNPNRANLQQAIQESLEPIIAFSRRSHADLSPCAQRVRDASVEILSRKDLLTDQYARRLASLLHDLDHDQIAAGLDECQLEGILYQGLYRTELLSPPC